MERKNDINLVAKLFLYLSLVANLILVISCCLKIESNFMLDLSLKVPVINMLFTIAILVAGVFIFRLSKVAMLFFISLFVIRLLVISALGGGYGFSFNLGTNLWLVIRDLLPFMIALCFKRDGVSGWKVLFSKNTLNRFNPNSNNALTLEDSNATFSLSEKDTNIKVVSNENAIREVDNNHSTLRKNNRIGLLLFSLISLILIASVLYFAFKIYSSEYPNYITTFQDKCKYYYSKPNNELAEKFITEYERAYNADLYELCEENLDAAWSVHPNDIKILNTLSLGYERIGKTIKNHSSKQDMYYGKSIEICAKAIAIDPNNIEIMTRIAKLYYNIGEYKKSYLTAEKILLNDPLNLMGIVIMCRKAYQNDDWASMLKWGEKAISIDCNNDSHKKYLKANILYTYSKGLYENGNIKEARKYYNEAKSLDIDGELEMYRKNLNLYF